MPIDPVTGSLIVAGANLVGQGANAWAQGKMNKKTREWNEKMYWIQRKAALEDFATQNAYNSPSEQMNRLRLAGLNPNLVYGHGADATGGVIRSTDAGSWNPKAPEIDLGGAAEKGLFAYQDIKLKQAQTDLLKENAIVAHETANAKKVDQIVGLTNVGKIGVETETGKYDLSMKKTLQDNIIATAGAKLDQIKAETALSSGRNVREAASNVVAIQKMGEEILSLRKMRAKNDAEIRHIDQQIENLRSAKTQQDIENNLREIGIQPGDKPLWRLILGNFIPRGWRRGSSLEGSVGGAVGSLRKKR